MRVLCIHGNRFLTKGKWYNLLKTKDNYYYIDVSDTEKSWYHKMSFETLEEYRENKLKSLGI